MGGKLNVFGLGSLGVNVDKNPINLEDGELSKAQNAIHDPSGSMGGIRKRKGLTKVNSVAAAGAVKGAIGVPISIGTAGNDIPAVAPNSRLFIQARRITSTTAGWNTSTDAWATSPTTGGPSGYDANATPRVPDYMWPAMLHTGDTQGHSRAAYSGKPSCMYKNKFFYAGNDYTYQVTSPSIRMFDGSADYLLGRVPTRSGVVAEAIIDMIVGGDDFIYFVTQDTGVFSANTLKTRIFQLDPESGAIAQIGSSFPLSPETVRVPYVLAWHQGRLWARTIGGGISSVSQRVYYFRIGIDSEWTSDATEAFESGVVLASFQGQLFMGTRVDAANPARIRVRSPLGVYSTSLTVALNEGGSVPVIPAAFGYGNFFGAAAVFDGNLYVSWYDGQVSATTTAGDRYMRIYKYNGSAWSVVYSPAANDNDNLPYTQAIVLGGKLFFVSAPARDSSTTLQRMIYTSNGSAFTSVTTSILDDVSGGVLGMIAS